METDTVAILPLGVAWPEIQIGQLAVLPLVAPALKGDFGVVRLAHRTLSHLGETFVRILQEVDADVYEFEQKHSPILFTPQKRIRTKQGLSRLNSHSHAISPKH